MKDRQYALNLLLDFLLQEIGISIQSCLAFQIFLRSRRRLIRRPRKPIRKICELPLDTWSKMK